MTLVQRKVRLVQIIGAASVGVRRTYVPRGKKKRWTGLGVRPASIKIGKKQKRDDEGRFQFSLPSFPASTFALTQRAWNGQRVLLHPMRDAARPGPL